MYAYHNIIFHRISKLSISTPELQMDSTMEDYRSQSKCITNLIVYENKIAAYMYNYINQLAAYSETLL